MVWGGGGGGDRAAAAATATAAGQEAAAEEEAAGGEAMDVGLEEAAVDVDSAVKEPELPKPEVPVPVPDDAHLRVRQQAQGGLI